MRKKSGYLLQLSGDTLEFISEIFSTFCEVWKILNKHNK